MDERLIRTLGAVTGEEQAILGGRKLDKSLYTDGRSFTVDRQRMLERGSLIALRPHTRFIEFPKHGHNYIEIMYVCAGSVTHTINEKQTVELKRGELLFLNCNAGHSIRKCGAGDIAVNFIVLPQFFDTAHEMTGGGNILSRFIADNLKGGGENALSYLHFRVADVLPVQNLVENLIYSITYKLQNRKNINQITMGLLFLQLLNQTERLEFPTEPDYDSRLVIALLREIEENYPTASLTALARELNQSVYQLSKMVKKNTGRTFKQILQEKRFSKALQMLSSTTLTVADIAAYVGYENTSYFHRKFLEVYGASPAKYREL